MNWDSSRLLSCAGTCRHEAKHAVVAAPPPLPPFPPAAGEAPAAALTVVTPSVFGVSLEVMCSPERAAVDGIPIVLAQGCRFVERFGLNVQGLYRIPGDQTVVSTLRSLYESGSRDTVAADEGTPVQRLFAALQRSGSDEVDSGLPQPETHIHAVAVR